MTKPTEKTTCEPTKKINTNHKIKIDIKPHVQCMHSTKDHNNYYYYAWINVKPKICTRDIQLYSYYDKKKEKNKQTQTIMCTGYNISANSCF